MFSSVCSDAPQERFCLSSASATCAWIFVPCGTTAARAATRDGSGGLGKNLRTSGEYERKSENNLVVCGIALKGMQSGITPSSPDNTV
jgi:hypothetical protein